MKRAFTLIEVLVVVAIIALLAAILLPSLQRAREQAKITVCKANEQQIGRMVMQYKAGNRDYVPVMLNYAAHDTSMGNRPVPARVCSMSVALRGADGKRPAPLLVDPSSNFFYDKRWSAATLADYENKLMPDWFACPFGRGGERINTVTTTSSWILYEIRGQTDSYEVWRWQGHYPNRDVVTQKSPPPWPAGQARAPGDGVAQYGAFSWNRGGWDLQGTDPRILNANRRWEISDGRFKPDAVHVIGQVSQVTVSWCALGEFIDWPGSKWARFNLGGHRTSQGGGTNALFADGHVAWVRGTRIGWQ